jgi:AcrR family transcriptional regulator
MASAEDSKRLQILDAATRVFAEKGYQYATISNIAKAAGISTGLVYSYFENKLDLLLSIILTFLQTLNATNHERIAAAQGPLASLHAVLHNFEQLLFRDRQSLHTVKVLNEALPHLIMIKEENLQDKRRAIIGENKKLLETFDAIISQGQKESIFDEKLNPAVMRQVLCGAIERLHYGLFFSSFSDQSIGYDEADAHKSIVRLIEKFICK